ncbi:hypothetical protein DFS34DRAFT_296217 [Phlyctochytrium arcticum]|nr:hypothetical protein DFS34DRAFT_296217 [Phlyctochytrium arcticum]
MPAGSQLPTEIMAQIVKHYRMPEGSPQGRTFYPDRRRDERTLWALCQVSRAWKNVAQPYLWSIVGDESRRDRGRRFLVALKANPQLGRLMKTLECRHPDSAPILLQPLLNFCPNLKMLYLNGCPEMHDYDVCKLTQKLDKLEDLTLLYCLNITENCWIKAIPLLKGLRHLHLDSSCHYRDQAVCAVVDACPHLQSLELWSKDLTSNGVLYIMLNAPKLVRLELMGTHRLTRQDIQNILRQRPARLQLSVYMEGAPGILVEATKTPRHNSKIIR